MAFTVAIVGRPNVGKSTLFNRLVGRRLALVDPTPGLTRDRREGEASLAGLKFRVIDTAGYEEGDPESLSARMWRQTEMAIAEADLSLLVIDAKLGVTPTDEAFARLVRASKKPVVLVANKCEGRNSDSGFYDSYSLGLGDPVAISAEHNLGLADLHEALWAYIGDAEHEVAARGAEGPLKLAIIGKPNVGKSTLLNQLVGYERMLTGPEPGLTRDAIAVQWEYEGKSVQLVDTAGMRRSAKVDQPLEEMAVEDSRRALGFAQVVAVVLDGTEPMARADLSIAALAVEEGRAVVIVVNKADVIDDRGKALTELRERLADSLSQVRGVPVVMLSARTGTGVEKLMPTVLATYERWNRNIPTGELNRWLEDVVARNSPPSPQGRPIRLRYMTQVASRPPRFVLFTSRPKDLPDSYIRYVVNDLREQFDLEGVPIRMTVRRSPGKAADFSLRHH